jgi:hypothetical protein
MKAARLSHHSSVQPAGTAFVNCVVLVFGGPQSEQEVINDIARDKSPEDVSARGLVAAPLFLHNEHLILGYKFGGGERTGKEMTRGLSQGNTSALEESCPVSLAGPCDSQQRWEAAHCLFHYHLQGYLSSESLSLLGKKIICFLTRQTWV